MRFELTTTRLLAIDAICLVLLAVTAYFTRATPRRLLGAVVAGAAIALVGVGFDVVGDMRGWWHYTSVSTRYGPPLMYVALALWYGAAVALIGWRVTRRFGWRGQVTFIAFMGVYGPLRDYVGTAVTDGSIQVMGPGIMPLVADVTLWAGLVAAAQGIMWIVAGPASADALYARVRSNVNRHEKTV